MNFINLLCSRFDESWRVELPELRRHHGDRQKKLWDLEKKVTGSIIHLRCSAGFHRRSQSRSWIYLSILLHSILISGEEAAADKSDPRSSGGCEQTPRLGLVKRPHFTWELLLAWISIDRTTHVKKNKRLTPSVLDTASTEQPTEFLSRVGGK